ncbi:MAG: DUF4388 domain-containing protein, partial [Verrucomicrobiales bacterium]|nr:DUF4388 domain-containing protein [Verrucomicrobiales bacterium]
ELVDAETEGVTGEEAFRKILAWKAGSFEILPPEPEHPRRILKSCNALLLETAQALDESAGAEPTPGESAPRPASRLATIAQGEEVEFVLAFGEAAGGGRFEALGLENPERLAQWLERTLGRFSTLGEQLRAGPLEQIIGLGLQRHVALAACGDARLCIGWRHSLGAAEVRERMKKVLATWS